MVRVKYIGVILIVALFLPTIIAQTAPPSAPPPDVNVAVFTKIEQEEKNTRKFVSDELTRQREEFYNQFDERAVFYEKEFFDALNTATLKLSVLWGSIVFCVIGLSNMLRITLERKRFMRMKETLKDELRAEMFLKNPPKPTQQQTVFEQPQAGIAAYAYKAPQPTLSDKDGFFARRKKHKLAKEIEAVERERGRQEMKAALLHQKLGGQPTSPQHPIQQQPYPMPPQNNPQTFVPAQMTSEQIAQMAAQYNQHIMEQYVQEQMAKMQQPPPKIPTPPQDLKVEVYH